MIGYFHDFQLGVPLGHILVKIGVVDGFEGMFEGTQPRTTDRARFGQSYRFEIPHNADIHEDAVSIVKIQSQTFDGI
jgi:hypothetical protein